MKRHPELVGLSREHQRALQLGLEAKRAVQANDIKTMQKFIHDCAEAFEKEFEPHFQEEERDLLPKLQAAGEKALVQRVLDDHAKLRRLAAKLPNWKSHDLMAFSDCMMAHVRFEERELFPRYEVLFLDGQD